MKEAVLTYLRQQKELGIPDFYFVNESELPELSVSVPVSSVDTAPGVAGSEQSGTSSPVVSVGSEQGAVVAVGSNPEIVLAKSEPDAVPPVSAKAQPPIAPVPTESTASSEPPPVVSVNQNSVLTDTQSAVPELRPSAAPPSRIRTYDEKRAALVELYREVSKCTGCILGMSRTKLVFGAGNAGAPLMIVGEAPGFEEDREGRPFIGPAGQLLDKMLAAVHIDREKQTFVSNIVKCRPPANRDPNATEVAACLPILRRQIEIIQPVAVLCLGRIAANELLGLVDGVGKLRQQLHEYRGIPVVVTYHPAALLRDAKWKRPAWEDMQRLRDILVSKGVSLS